MYPNKLPLHSREIRKTAAATILLWLLCSIEDDDGRIVANKICFFSIYCILFCYIVLVGEICILLAHLQALVFFIVIRSNSTVAVSRLSLADSRGFMSIIAFQPFFCYCRRFSIVVAKNGSMIFSITFRTKKIAFSINANCEDS